MHEMDVERDLAGGSESAGLEESVVTPTKELVHLVCGAHMVAAGGELQIGATQGALRGCDLRPRKVPPVPELAEGILTPTVNVSVRSKGASVGRTSTDFDDITQRLDRGRGGLGARGTLLMCLRTPALDCAVNEQRATVPAAQAEALCGARKLHVCDPDPLQINAGIDLAIVIASPTHDGAVADQRTRVLATRGQADRVLNAKIDGTAVEGVVLTKLERDLSPVILAPTPHGSILQGTDVK